MSAAPESGQQPPPTGRHDHFMRPRRMTVRDRPPHLDPKPNLSSMTHSASASTSSSQYVTRSTTGSLSPIKRQMEGTSTSPEGLTEADQVDDGDAGGDLEAQAKLENKRERNRVKQRNLRLRRNIQLQDLEDTVGRLSRENTLSRNQISTLTTNEAKYASWVHELETALIQAGSRVGVDRLRSVWGKGIVANSSKRSSGRKSKGKGVASSSSSSRGIEWSGSTTDVGGSDPLATLARAAMSTEQSLVPIGAYHTAQPDLILPSLGSEEVRNAYPSNTSHQAVPSASHHKFGSIPGIPSYHHIPSPHISQLHPHQGVMAHRQSPVDYNRRPSTSYTHAPTPWAATPHLDPTHPALKRKRSVSGPILHPLPPAMGVLHSLSEPSTSTTHSPFQPIQATGTILPPILSLPNAPGAFDPPSILSSPTRNGQPSFFSSATLPHIRPITVPSTPPHNLPPGKGSQRLVSRSSTSPRGMSIDDLLTPRAGDKGKAEVASEAERLLEDIKP